MGLAVFVDFVGFDEEKDEMYNVTTKRVIRERRIVHYRAYSFRCQCHIAARDRLVSLLLTATTTKF